MLKRMWLDLTTGWGGWQIWVALLLLLTVGTVCGVVVVVIALVLALITGLSPDAAILIVIGLGILACWAQSAYERSRKETSDAEG